MRKDFQKVDQSVKYRTEIMTIDPATSSSIEKYPYGVVKKNTYCL